MRVFATPVWCRVSTCSGLARVSESVWLRLGNLRELRRRVRIPGGSRRDDSGTNHTLSLTRARGRAGRGQGPAP